MTIREQIRQAVVEHAQAIFEPEGIDEIQDHHRFEEDLLGDEEIMQEYLAELEHDLNLTLTLESIKGVETVGQMVERLEEITHLMLHDPETYRRKHMLSDARIRNVVADMVGPLCRVLPHKVRDDHHLVNDLKADSFTLKCIVMNLAIELVDECYQDVLRGVETVGQLTERVKQIIKILTEAEA